MRAMRSGPAGSEFSLRDLKTGAVTDLDQYEGKVSLIVNVASK